jgi:hypothetical protein
VSVLENALEETGDSPEMVAFHLMQAVLAAEKKIGRATRKEILDTYAECLIATKGRRDIGSATEDMTVGKAKPMPRPVNAA